MLVFADGLQIVSQFDGEILRAGDLVIFFLVHALLDRLLHLFRDVGKDVRIVETLQNRIDHFGARRGVDREIRLLHWATLGARDACEREREKQQDGKPDEKGPRGSWSKHQYFSL